MSIVYKIIAGSLKTYSNTADLFKDAEVEFDFADVWVADGQKHFEIDYDSVQLLLPTVSPGESKEIPDQFELEYGTWFEDEQGVEPYFKFNFNVQVKDRKPLPNGDVELVYDFDVLEAFQEG